MQIFPVLSNINGKSVEYISNLNVNDIKMFLL